MLIVFSCLVLVVGATSCINVKAPVSVSDSGNGNQLTSEKSSHNFLMQAVLWQQNAAEYRALCYQAFNTAKFRLDQALQQRKTGNKPPAIITDIDETVLNNSPFEAKMILDDMDYSSKAWAQWTGMAQAKAIPGAIKFLQYAHAKGVQIFYVSNRSVSAEESTLKNMKVLGFPDANKKHLLFKSETSAKQSRFTKVEEAHEVLLFMGDNLSDFTSKFRVPSTQKRNALADQLQDEFGKKFIVLPNPMYGDWETKGLFEGRYDWTEAQKDSIRRANLKAY